VTYHDRTAYEHPPERDRDRLDPRLWLARPSQLRLDTFEVRWRSIEPGVSRGGIPQAA
jgi:hypothetical protein